jgi:hypothetical protein
MRKIVAVAALCLSLPALAGTAFLVKQWVEKGDQMCRYDNGTVLNVGARLCPLSIKT